MKVIERFLSHNSESISAPKGSKPFMVEGYEDRTLFFLHADTYANDARYDVSTVNLASRTDGTEQTVGIPSGATVLAAIPLTSARRPEAVRLVALGRPAKDIEFRKYALNITRGVALDYGTVALPQGTEAFLIEHRKDGALLSLFAAQSIEQASESGTLTNYRLGVVKLEDNSGEFIKRVAVPQDSQFLGVTTYHNQWGQEKVGLIVLSPPTEKTAFRHLAARVTGGMEYSPPAKGTYIGSTSVQRGKGQDKTWNYVHVFETAITQLPHHEHWVVSNSGLATGAGIEDGLTVCVSGPQFTRAANPKKPLILSKPLSILEAPTR